jgi:hypothetical protein
MKVHFVGLLAVVASITLTIGGSNAAPTTPLPHSGFQNIQYNGNGRRDDDRDRYRHRRVLGDRCARRGFFRPVDQGATL